MSETKFPYYVIDFNAAACFFEIRINDVPVESMNIKGQLSTISPINHLILESGKQVVDFIILPTLDNLTLNEKVEFSASIDLYDVEGAFKLFEKNDLFEISDPPTGLPFIKHKSDFLAKVPYKISSWQNSTNLNDVEDLRKLVDKAYKRIENLINAKQYNIISELFKQRENNTCISMYLSEEEKSKRINGLIDDFQNGFVVVPTSPEDIMFIYGYGKLVSLKQKNGDSALHLKNDKTGEEMTLEIMFHLEKGKQELSII
ncbi:MAG: hypothetical protein ACOYO1_00635 [Bacteroidales bacterium]